MAFKGKSLVILLVIVVQGVVSTSDVCRDAVAPPSKPRGVNQVNRTSTTPLFELHVTPVEIKENSRTLSAYKVVSSLGEGGYFRFSEATLAVSTEGSCGSGDFDFRIEDYTEVVQDQGEECPRLFQTKKKTLMTELQPLIWIPPSCGCVTLRMLLVESGNIYYAENEATSNGPLAKTICFKPPKQQAQITREHRLASLCHVIDKHSSAEIMSRSQFQRHRKLEAGRMDHLGLEMALELRRNDVRMCCKMINADDKALCFDNARRRRIDQFCEDGIPDIPFKTFRKSHMRTLEKACCFLFGELRYKCFAQNSDLSARKEETTLFDYSMDASDLANDLAEFGSHEHLDSYLKPITFGNGDDVIESEDQDNSDVDVEDEELDELSDEIMDEEDAAVTKTSAKKLHVRKSPAMEESREYDVEKSSTSSPTTMSAERILSVMSKKEIKKLMRRKSKGRNSKENRRLTSRERGKKVRVGGGGGGSRRKSGRRGSAERRLSAERRSDTERRASAERRLSAERRVSAERRAWFDRRSSAERRANPDRRFSAERRRNIDRRGSAERRDKIHSNPLERFDDRLSGLEPKFDDTKKRGHARSRVTDIQRGDRHRVTQDNDVMVPGQYGFDDQGGSSMDRTLNKLQKKMRRLKLLNMCCQAGVDMGGQVYGGIRSVRDECGHSSDKFVRGVSLGGRARKCGQQFVDCCLEEAKKGLTMTSQEFLDNTAAHYWESPHQYDPKLVQSVLSQRGRRPAALPDFQGNRRPIAPIGKSKTESSPDTQNSKKSIQKTVQVTTGKHIPNLPKVDNKAEDIETAVTSAKHSKLNSQNIVPSFKTGSELRNENLQENHKKTRPGVLPTKESLSSQRTDIPVVETGDLTDSTKQGNSSSHPVERPVQSSRKTTQEKVSLGSSRDDGITQASVDGGRNDVGLVKLNNESRIHKGQGRKKYNDVMGKESLKEKSVTADKKTITQNKILKSKVEKSSQSIGQPAQRETTQQIKNTMGERTMAKGRQMQRNRNNNRRSNGKRRRKYRTKVVALDSREMAEKNTRHYMDALDSREMADQYVKRNYHNNSRMGRWSRHRARDYRYAVPSDNKDRRRRFWG